MGTSTKKGNAALPLRLALGLLAVAPFLLGAGIVRPAAQAGQACDPAAACFDAAISLAYVVGDFYLDGALVATGVNNTRIVTTPATPHVLEVRNMQSPDVAGFGSLFIYPDQSLTQQANAGWVWRVFFYPRQQYIRGTLRYRCLPYGFRASDSVACRPTIDGVTMPDVGPGGSASFTLDPGTH